MAKYAWRNEEDDLCFDKERFARIVAAIASDASNVSELWWLSETMVAVINSVFADRSNEIYEELAEESKEDFE